ncbi:MAG: hypothetical protein IJS87_06720, partial [Rhodocyclaceae bacterium]|nr:hypothetical protein [Rhodocyclaceae bacterium]
LLPWRTQAEDAPAAFRQYDGFMASQIAEGTQTRNGAARIWSDAPLADNALSLTLTVRDVLLDSRRHFGQRLEYVGTAGEASHVHQQG